MGLALKRVSSDAVLLIMPRDIVRSPKPKHSLIAEAISAQIKSKKYRPGDLLPSESELSKSFGVSRHTIRTALRSLASLGFVASHQGVGTRILATKQTLRYDYTFNSIPELQQYATQTVVQILDIKEIVADTALAKYLACNEAERWWQIRTLRSEHVGGAVGAYSEIFVPYAFGAVIPLIKKNTNQAVFLYLEKYLKEHVVEIRQEIAAISLSPAEAQYLQVKRNTPALEITRRYFRKNQDVFEIVRVVHPAGLFKYAMQIIRQQS